MVEYVLTLKGGVFGSFQNRGKSRDTSKKTWKIRQDHKKNIKNIMSDFLSAN
jgi:hypothetical protein